MWLNSIHLQDLGTAGGCGLNPRLHLPCAIMLLEHHLEHLSIGLRKQMGWVCDQQLPRV